MINDFVIDQVGWHINTPRNYTLDISLVHKYFECIIKYLQENKLVVRNITVESMVIDNNTCIRSSDLTPDGLLLMKEVYGKWVDGIMDKGKSPTDYRILDKALKKIRTR